MRIAHVISTPAGLGGAEQVLTALVARGRTEGWDQLVLNPFARSKSSDLSLVLGDADYRPLVSSRLSELPGSRRWIDRQLMAFEPDVIHAHLFHALVAVSSLPSSGSIRVVTHHHGDFFRAQGRKRDALIDKAMGKRFDSVVAVSESVRRFLVDDYGYPSSKVVVIRNGWSGAPVDDKQTGLTPIIACVGNLRREKGHVVLLRAIAAMIRERPVRLILVGDGPLRDELTAEATALGIQDDVEFVGTVRNVWPILSEADIFAFPSLSEPLGIAVMEAMAAGLPVVASRVGGIPEVVEDGTTGYLVSPGDATLLSRRIIELVDDREKRASMGRAGRAAAESMRMETTVDAYLGHYCRLLSIAQN